MLTVLAYLGFAVLVAAIVFVVARYAFGPDEQMAPPPSQPAATWLPATSLTGADLRGVRFRAVLRGYSPADVDRVLARAAAELDALRGDVAMLRMRVAELERTQ